MAKNRGGSPSASLASDAGSATPLEDAFQRVAASALIYSDDLPLLHIYPQAHWHCEARIVGNRPGLAALRDALDRALVEGGANAAVSAIDGEHYEVEIARTNDVGLRYTRLPYHPEWGGATGPEFSAELNAALDTLRAAILALPEDGSQTRPADASEAEPKATANHNKSPDHILTEGGEG